MSRDALWKANIGSARCHFGFPGCVDRSSQSDDSAAWDVWGSSSIRCGSVMSARSQTVCCRALQTPCRRRRLRADRSEHGLNVGNGGFLDGEVPVPAPVAADDVVVRPVVFSLYLHCCLTSKRSAGDAAQPDGKEPISRHIQASEELMSKGPWARGAPPRPVSAELPHDRGDRAPGRARRLCRLSGCCVAS